MYSLVIECRDNGVGELAATYIVTVNVLDVVRCFACYLCTSVASECNCGPHSSFRLSPLFSMCAERGAYYCCHNLAVGG